MPKACILGGGGYFGQHVAKRFQQEGYHVNVLDVFFDTNIPNVSLDRKQMTEFKGSILDENLVRQALTGCSVCVHIAAYGMGGPGALNRDLVFKINLDGTNLVMDLCRELGVKRFINSSSVSVIFTRYPLDMADESYPYPEKYSSYYAESKALAEKSVKTANCDGFSTVSLRYRGIYGPGEPKSTNRAAEVIYRGLYLGEFDESAPTLTQFSGVENTVEACILADRALKERPEVVGGKIYNIVDGGDPVDSFAFWHPLIQALDRPLPSIRFPFAIVFFFAYLCELGYVCLGIPPLVLRLEIALMGVSNTYSIEAAQRDLHYAPKNNHDTRPLCEYYSNYYKKNPVWRIDWRIFFLVILVTVAYKIYF